MTAARRYAVSRAEEDAPEGLQMMVMFDRVAQRYHINPLDLVERDPFALRIVQLLGAAKMLTDSTEPDREEIAPDDPLVEFMETL